MSDEFRSKFDPTRRLEELRGKGSSETAEARAADAEEERDAPPDPYSTLSADRQHKLMVELRFKTGNAKALSYSYLVGIDFDPSAGMVLDFSGYTVQITGRNLRPLFAGLAAQRVAVVNEVDDLHAEATLAKDATVVTGIEVKER